MYNHSYVTEQIIPEDIWVRRLIIIHNNVNYNIKLSVNISPSVLGAAWCVLLPETISHQQEDSTPFREFASLLTQGVIATTLISLRTHFSHHLSDNYIDLYFYINLSNLHVDLKLTCGTYMYIYVDLILTCQTYI